IPRLTKGPVTVELEAKWAANLGTRHSVFVNSGSSAILLLLAALKAGGRLRNGKIVVPAVSWLTDVSSPMQLGMEPILCDCNLEDLSCDLGHLERIFEEQRPAAMILVSVLGLVPDMAAVLRLCAEYDVLLMEDVCESMGSEYDGKFLGTFGAASVFSMYHGHHLSTIEGGFVCTDDKELNDLLLSLRSHGWDRDLDAETQNAWRAKFETDAFSALYQFYHPGFNLRSTDLQAYIGLTQLDKLEEIRQRRNRNFEIYRENINCSELQLIERGFISNFAFPVVSRERREIVMRLSEDDVEVRPLIAGNMARKAFWLKAFGPVELPYADLIEDHGFYLPNHQYLKEEDVLRICEIVNAKSLDV
nr:DegT/DnrJ/EryC1/StrS aminotransferase family protein [Blastocatellia bacterium]